MPTLKTFVTSVGFVELAVAATSRKAALTALGVGENAFRHGHVTETQLKSITSVTSSKPGVVLERAVGSKGTFSTKAGLPLLPTVRAPRQELPVLRPKRTTKESERSRPPISVSEKKTKRDTPPAKSRKDDLSQKRMRQDAANRAQALKVEKRRAEHEAKTAVKQAEGKARARAAAKRLFDEAQKRHETRMSTFDRERADLTVRETKEEKRWAAEKLKLTARL